MLTNKGKYGLKAMVHLAGLEPGALAPISCASVTAFRACADCGDLRTCPVRLIMIEARNAIADVLDNRTLAEMRMLAGPADLEATYHN
jgi:DNA-binding IscR family transcriptional regulator